MGIVVRFSIFDLLAATTCVGIILGMGVLVPWRQLGDIFAMPPLAWGMVIVLSLFFMGGVILWWLKERV